MRFYVEVPDDILRWAFGEGNNRQSIAKFMREELQNVGRRYGQLPELDRAKTPGQSHEWRAFIFNDVMVAAETKIAKQKAPATIERSGGSRTTLRSLNRR